MMLPSDNPTATVGLAVLVSVILQALKNATWFPWLTRATARLNFWVALLAAGVSTALIHIQYDPATGGTITLPSLTGLMQWLVQWAAQHAAYKVAVVPAETLGEIRALLERPLTPPPVSAGAAKAGEGDK